MDYKKIDRIADRIKNPTKTPFQKAMSKLKGERRDAMKTPMKKLSNKEKYEKLMANKMKSGGLTGGQKKLDKNKNNRIDAQDFKILKAEKAKGRGMGLQDEKIQPGKVQKAFLGKMIKGAGKSIGRLFGKKKSATKIPSANVSQKASLPINLVEEYKKAKGLKKGGGADTGRMGELKSKLAVAMDRAKKGMGSRPGSGERLSKEDIKKATDILKNKKTKSGSSVKDIFKSYGKYDGKPIELSKGGGADMGTKMSDKRRKKLKDILSRLTAPRTINIKKEFKSGTSNPMQRDRKREGYRAKVEKAGGKVMFADERGMKKFKNFMGGGMMNKPMGYKKGASIMARGCKLGRKKATKLY